jgi:SpoU rRNA methylase family enzyme
VSSSQLLDSAPASKGRVRGNDDVVKQTGIRSSAVLEKTIGRAATIRGISAIQKMAAKYGREA